MTDLHLLAREIKALSAKVSPFISMEEMTERYGVCTKTILAMVYFNPSVSEIAEKL